MNVRFTGLAAILAVALSAVVLVAGERNVPAPVQGAAIDELLHPGEKNICREVRTGEVAFEEGSAGRRDDLPLDIEISPSLRLFDQTGRSRNVRRLLEGRMSLVFFGYSTCDGICPTALPAMASTVDILAQRGIDAQPVLVTIDPERDTPAGLAERLPRIGRTFIGLTGPDAMLRHARRMFHIQAEPVFEDEGGTVFRHGSFIYIVDPAGEIVSFLPPVLPPARIAEIVQGYL
ncbi:MAG: SCO family protein [Geminicoccaceae bacterium]